MARENFTSPKGKAKWAKLNTPDEYEGKKTYKVQLILGKDSAEWASLKNLIDEQTDEAFESNKKQVKPQKLDEYKKHYPYENEYEEGQPTGNVSVKFSMNAEFMRGEELVKMKPKLYDAQLKQIHDISIGNGSEIKISYCPYQYHNPSNNTAGVSLKMVAVQVINLVEYGGSAGFAKEEGYIAPTVAPEKPDVFTEAEGDMPF